MKKNIASVTAVALAMAVSMSSANAWSWFGVDVKSTVNANGRDVNNKSNVGGRDLHQNSHNTSNKNSHNTTNSYNQYDSPTVYGNADKAVFGGIGGKVENGDFGGVGSSPRAYGIVSKPNESIHSSGRNNSFSIGQGNGNNQSIGYVQVGDINNSINGDSAVAAHAATSAVHASNAVEMNKIDSKRDVDLARINANKEVQIKKYDNMR